MIGGISSPKPVRRWRSGLVILCHEAGRSPASDGRQLGDLDNNPVQADREPVVAAPWRRVSARLGIPAESLFICATTHIGPSDGDPAFWPDGLESHIEAAVVAAYEQLAPARVGAGWGMVHGHVLNRRRSEDPVDPAVFTVRIDAEDGHPLGVYYGYACHAVVMGPDSLIVTGDWPGVVSRIIESTLGASAVAVFGQGSCGDVNPLTPQVTNGLRSGHLVSATTERTYYGPDEPCSTSAIAVTARWPRPSSWAKPLPTR